jgi:probable rRNA maturation factor
LNRVWVSDDTGYSAKLAADVKQVLLRGMRLLKLRETGVSLLLTTDGEIARLNRTFRKMNRPTDVLSFPQEASARKGERVILGDIAISVPTAKRQAMKNRHPARTEFAMLAVHGLLHLLGHDHAEKDEADRMFSLQGRILRKVGPRD